MILIVIWWLSFSETSAAVVKELKHFSGAGALDTLASISDRKYIILRIVINRIIKLPPFSKSVWQLQKGIRFSLVSNTKQLRKFTWNSGASEMSSSLVYLEEELNELNAEVLRLKHNLTRLQNHAEGHIRQCLESTTNRFKEYCQEAQLILEQYQNLPAEVAQVTLMFFAFFITSKTVLFVLSPLLSSRKRLIFPQKWLIWQFVLFL